VPRVAELLVGYDAQQALLSDWLQELPEQVADQPSRLPGWSVRQLAAHVTEVPRALRVAIEAGQRGRSGGERSLSIADYTSKWGAAAGEIARRAGDAAGTLRGPELAERLEREGQAMHQALAGVPDGQVVAARRGPIKAVDMLTTRVNELVVHSLDLSASAPECAALTVDPGALGTACRMLASILSERAPGRSVEVRIPPYAAVQCVAGPRHTRGTPGSVVEIEPVAWVELATGRLGWDDAVTTARLQCSGERSDLSSLLPVLS
jgi:uncharacterized protein (TIGR03083 family)